MKIPKKFHYLGKTYTVHLVDPSIMEGKLGCTEFAPCRISIRSDATPQVQQQTFLHELLHVVIYEMGIDKTLNLSFNREEQLVNSLSNGLFGLLDVLQGPSHRAK